MFRLFSHKKFVDMLRLHSKTILKMNASVVLFSLMLLIAIFNNISAYPNFKAKACLAGESYRKTLRKGGKVRMGNLCSAVWLLHSSLFMTLY